MHAKTLKISIFKAFKFMSKFMLLNSFSKYFNFFLDMKKFQVRKLIGRNHTNMRILLLKEM